jgi:hypothetical protein
LCVGVAVVLQALIQRFRASDANQAATRVWWIPTAMAGLIILGNLPTYALELYIRHFVPYDFYDVARQGATAEMIDIGGYLQKHAAPGETIWVNVGGLSQRVGFFLSGERIKVPAKIAPKLDPDSEHELERFLKAVPGRYAIAFATHAPYPEWHWPINRSGHPKQSWWRLYERDAATGQFQRVLLPRERSYVRSIPPARLK